MTTSVCEQGVLQSCSGGLAGGVAAVAMLVVAIALLVGVRRSRPLNPRPWRALSVALLLIAAGRGAAVLAEAFGSVSSLGGWLSIGGVVAGLGVATFGADAVLAGSLAHRERTVDAMVVATASGLALWQLVVGPLLAAGGGGWQAEWAARIVTAASVPTFAALLRLGWTCRRNTSGALVAVGGSIGVLGVVLATVPRPSPFLVAVVALSWTLSIVLCAIAALHPALGCLGRSVTRDRPRTSRRRLLGLLASLVVAGPLAMLDQAPETGWGFAAESVAVLFVVVAGGFRIVRFLRAQAVADAHVQRQLELQEALNDLGRRSMSTSEAQGFVDALVATAAELLGADAAAMVEPVPGQDLLRYRCGIGFPARVLATGRIGLQDTLAGEALARREPIVVDDLLAERRFESSTQLRAMGFVSAVVVPVVGRDAVHGLLALFIRQRRRYGPQDVRFLEAAAHVLAANLDRGEVETRLRQRARHDPLTGLPNRPHLLERLETACRRAGDQGPTVVAIEVDGIDAVTDTLGHDAGDALVTAVADRLATCFADGDTLGRYADDTFVGVWTGPASARDDLVAIISAALSPPFPVSEGEVFVRATIGTAVGAKGLDPHDLLRMADLALVAAKREGGWQAAFVPEMAIAAQHRLQLETDLRHALERGEFTCHYQPQVDMRDGRVVGIEALVRWCHPRFGLVAPGVFIEVAEQTGLIAALDRWVLAAACEQARVWRDAGHDVPRLSVNVSAATLQHGDLPGRLAAVLADTGVDPAQLELEITESSVMRRPEEALATLRALRDTGVRVAIDDFGTGYSSLSYLQRFPVDTLKIDRSFVSTLSGDDASGSGILRAIVAVGRHLGLDLVAEGIETACQRDALRDLGCDVAQGFFYARPEPADIVVSRFGALQRVAHAAR